MTDDGTRRPWPRSSHRLLKVAAWCFAVAVLAAGFWFMTTRPVHVRAARPQRGEIAAEVFGTGTLESKIVVGVSSKIVGKVIEVTVDQGDAVTAGQTLARLEARDFADAVRVALAQREQARAELVKAKADLQREEPLFASGLVPKADLDAYAAADRVAEAKLSNLEAALGVAEAKNLDTNIVSPASGLVITRNLEVGSTGTRSPDLPRSSLDSMGDGRDGRARDGRAAPRPASPRRV